MYVKVLLAVFFGISFYLGSNSPLVIAESTNQSDEELQRVINYQPNLIVSSKEKAQNNAPIQVFYSVKYAKDAEYYTYIYVWTFSDTQWWGELLGYPDHNWDYEPIIVRVDNKNSEINYYYDSGHYQAGITTNGQFSVENGTHRYTPTNSGVGESFSVERFKKLTTLDIDEMNDLIEYLPRLPFGRKLSLDWAYNSPWKVADKGAFSTDDRVAQLPWQVNIVGSTALGIVLGILLVLVRLKYKSLGFSRWLHTFIFYVIAGVIGGIAGGFISPVVLELIDIKGLSIVVSVASGCLAFFALGFTVRRKYPFDSSPIIRTVGISCVSLSALLTSVW